MGGPRTRGERAIKAIGATVFGFVLVMLYAPSLVMFVLSFQERQTALFPPTDFSFISYRKLFEPNNYELFNVVGEPLTNYFPPVRLSLILALMTAVVSTALALAAALAFRERIRGKGILFYLLLLGMLTPGVILGLGMRLFADKIGLDPHWYTTGLVTHLVWTMPFGFVVFLIFLNRFDRQIEEAAALLGASPLRVFRTITLPMLAPAVMGSLLFGFTLSFDEVQRSSLVMGADQTLPQELVATTGIRITPVVYALGTLIALVSLIAVAVYIIAFERERRRAYETEPVEERAPAQAPASESASGVRRAPETTTA
jgi:putative spermidine/putrescine transport system permease protein